MTAADQHDIQQENHRRIVSYLENGAHRVPTSARHADGTLDTPGALGVEVEHFVVKGTDATPVFYTSHDDDGGVQSILSYLAQYYPEVTRNREGDILGLASEEGSITIEPAAQLEISIAPFARIKEVEQVYRTFRERVDEYFAKKGFSLVAQGYHPSMRACDMELIPKGRYRMMDEHFHRIGTHGERMMRASASTQVSIDYSSEQDAVRKFRVALAMAPILGLICDNVSVFEGEPNTHYLARLNLWRDVDNARCGAIPGVFDEGWGFDAYTDYLLSTSPIFVPKPTERAVGDTPAREVYASTLMERDDIEHLISMFWPDVRLKQFVEIRPADSLPELCVYGYTALIKGIMYAEENLAAIEEALGVVDGLWPLQDGSIDAAIETIRLRGAQAELYGHSVAWWIEMLFDLAQAVLDEEERPYLAPLLEFAQSHVK